MTLAELRDHLNNLAMVYGGETPVLAATMKGTGDEAVETKRFQVRGVADVAPDPDPPHLYICVELVEEGEDE